MKWNAEQGLTALKERAYNYGYDALNRITSASHKEKTVSWAATNSFSESDYSYDLNGNIMGLTRNTTGGNPLDALIYDYGSGATRSNQLLKVSDGADKAKGFIDGANSDNDYTYDANGSMLTDKNKDLTAANAIQYNHLNLPKQVTKTNGDYIIYTYDATGRKVRQEVFNAGNQSQKSTDYLGEFIYENGILQFINTEEGRVVMTPTAGEYQYHLKDHLGNVRTTFTTLRDAEETKATLEDATLIAEQASFYGSTTLSVCTLPCWIIRTVHLRVTPNG
ncbi:MAG: hypothetical protein WDN75_05135 [Bacteroidota bacterium]